MCTQNCYSIKSKPTTNQNIPSASNAIITLVHKVVNDMLRSFDLENNHESLLEQGDNPFAYFLQSLHVYHAIKSIYYVTIQETS
jgi:hypothetical protein